MATTTPPPQARSRQSSAGPAHVAVVSFLASRLVPSGGFWVALAGGVALARVGERRGAREGYGASIATLVETVAIIGPSRFAVPFTQAVTAPLLGRFEARGMPAWLQILICGVLRMLQNSVTTAFLIWIVAGGLDAYAGTYEAIGRRLGLEVGTSETLVVTFVGLAVWACFASIVQVLVYRRGLQRWDRLEAGLDGEAATSPSVPDEAPAPPAPPARLNPYLVVALAIVAFVVLLASTAWIVLAIVGGLLVLGWACSRPDRAPLATGLAFAALLGLGAFVFSFVGGLGLEVALRRALRAILLVLVATWMRAAARAEGLRLVMRSALARLRRLPAMPEAAAVLDSLDSERRLAASARAVAATLRDVPLRPLPFVDAVLGWVVREASAVSAPGAPPAARS